MILCTIELDRKAALGQYLFQPRLGQQRQTLAIVLRRFAPPLAEYRWDTRVAARDSSTGGDTVAKTKKNPLKELSKHLPSDPEIETLMSTMSTESDYIVAITGVSLVEAALEKLILLKLQCRNKDLDNRLFGFEGPLGTFSGKIAVAAAFGVITTPLMRELDAFRNLRNAFAHSRTPLSFSNPVVANEVMALGIVKAVNDAGGPRLASANKSQFLISLRVVLIILKGFSENPHLSPSEILDRALQISPARPRLGEIFTRVSEDRSAAGSSEIS